MTQLVKQLIDYKMNKKIYLTLLAAAAISLGACSDEESIFDTSAAERLEAGRRQFTEALTADGGIWAMEYFTNYEEPGYTFVCQFQPDGSVVMSGDHEWVNNTFTSEKSLWKVICDNGNVLTFNTYNNVFHIFSTPEDVEGTPVNELGYGHMGDYEFMLMPRTGDSIRLLGKKHGLTAWLHKLPADTDPETYLKDISSRKNVFSSKFATLTLTDSRGETYSVSNLRGGVPSILSDLSTSPNSQTVTGNGIYTPTGFRFMEPLTVIRHDDSQWTLTELSWTPEGALEGDGAIITAPLAGFNLQNARYSWMLDKESMSPALLAAHNAANDALIANYGSSRDLRNVTFGYQNNAGRPCFALTTRVGRFVCNDFYTLEVSENGKEATLTHLNADSSAEVYNASTPEYAAFKALFTDSFSVVNISALDATTMVLTSKSNPGISFHLNVQ